jgi:diaminopimelate epimerase
MHGIGNDYVYVDCFKERVKDPAALSRAISDRHFGVGSDGLVLIMPSTSCDLRMRMFNADGSEAEMCGNAVRCIGKYAYEHGLVTKTIVSLETKSGVKVLHMNVNNGIVESVRVDMGEPGLTRGDLPMVGDPGTRVIGEALEVDGRVYHVTGVSMGNPHCVVFGVDPSTLKLEELGPKFENHPAFPARVNTEFCQVLDRRHLRMRVWERGSGETLACGTGACATAVAAILNGYTEREVTIDLRGGSLEIAWGDDKHVYMTGPAVEVFSGEWPEKLEEER